MYICKFELWAEKTETENENEMKEKSIYHIYTSKKN
jgi:hypothetical protein